MQPKASNYKPPIIGEEKIYAAYADMVYRLAFIRARNSADADDILMEVFVRWLRSKPVWTDADHQKAWFIRVAVNVSNTYLTSAWRRHRAEAPDETLVDMTENTEVYREVLSLPEKYRTAIHLYYYEGYSVKEMAALLKCGESAVKSRLSRARAMLHEQLREV